ncbi:ATP-dependent DNA ligase [Candidatus Woesearchaeota archaeon]|jgi:DNA ligase-1|nr:ATP-dependent DNA ligase [Candidatus Woesearchaeota archaeon]MBT4835006.1 ATP-dependent DNA ligase [Candidatus Woesearchaeota archaeon]MBT6735171.1 ATP-dependent DNA ligase [Candidatus Woesearchaeota archaeon]MBT7170111.1 ATP-dependent DNA ligase [Candidatus Woesearchaeota archaeon]MBT7474960.1 ATP-dependent DNA ligase [Candidatus Woesearchaeota archaeon]
MDYSDLTKTYNALEATTKRLEKTEIISKLLRKTKESELKQVIYLLQGIVFPKWDERKTGMSSRLVLKAINSATGVSITKLEKEWVKKGDLGIVIEEQIQKSKQTSLFKKKLTIEKVFNNIRKLAELEGKGTVTKKIQYIIELLTSAENDEAKFIIRTIIEDLRIGVKVGVMKDSITLAFEKEQGQIENAYNLTNDFAEVALAAKNNKLSSLKMEIGKPINPMLAIRIESPEEAFNAVGVPALIEDKLDGFRLQIHKKGDEISLFTRRLENITNQFKEILPIIRSNVKLKNTILDSELVGYDPKTKKHLPFQNISQRIRRKYNISEVAEKLPVEIQVFDILNEEGKSLLNLDQEKRRKILEKSIKSEKTKITITKKLVTNSKKEMNEFYKRSLGEGNEGIMIKSLESKYVPGRRVGGWVKLKPIKETLDLVIIGADWGEGKRANWLASFTLACRDKNELLTIGKVGTGISEKDADITFDLLTKELKPLIKETDGKHVILKPKIILEIGYEEIQTSPTYKSGYALRFPKVVNLRKDLGFTDIDDLIKVEKIFKTQRK